MSTHSKKIYLILHNIRSTHNVGSIFRTADAAGAPEIFLTGYTPKPIDRFGRSRSDVSKVALGAEKVVLWQYRKNLRDVIKELKKKGVEIVAVEQSDNAEDYKKIKPSTHCALVLGNEVRGLSRSVLNQCDRVAEIPMKGKKESLNVSVTAGIALFRIFNI